MAAARRRRGGTPRGGQAADEVGRFIGPSPAGFKADDDETAVGGVLELGVDLVAFKAAPGVVSDRSRAAPSRPTGLTRVVSTVVLRDRAADREQGVQERVSCYLRGRFGRAAQPPQRGARQAASTGGWRRSSH